MVATSCWMKYDVRGCVRTGGQKCHKRTQFTRVRGDCGGGEIQVGTCATTGTSVPVNPSDLPPSNISRWYTWTAHVAVRHPTVRHLMGVHAPEPSDAFSIFPCAVRLSRSLQGCRTSLAQVRRAGGAGAIVNFAGHGREEGNAQGQRDAGQTELGKRAADTGQKKGLATLVWV